MEWDILPTVSLTAAARADTLWLSRTGPASHFAFLKNDAWSQQVVEPSYNLGAVWHPTEPDRFRLTIARGVQLPSLLDYSGVQDMFASLGTVLGNPRINPTVIQNYEIDWDRDLPSINAQSRVAVFYQTTEELQSLITPFGARFEPSGAFVGIVGNIGSSREIGSEFSLTGRVGENWHWHLSYSPRFISDRYKTGAAALNTGTNFSDTTPKHVVDASLGWSQGAWEVDTFLRFQSAAAGLLFNSFQGYALVPLGPTVRFDTRVGYRITDAVTLSFLGQNVLFSSARQTNFSKVEQQVLGRLSVSF